VACGVQKPHLPNSRGQAFGLTVSLFPQHGGLMQFICDGRQQRFPHRQVLKSALPAYTNPLPSGSVDERHTRQVAIAGMAIPHE
jgi:hypothetical protein